MPDEVSRALYEGEDVLWSGKSVRAARWDAADTVCAAALLFVLAFSAFWQAVAWYAPLVFRLFGLVVPVVFAVVIGRYFVSKRGRRDRYVLTTRRLMTVTRTGITATPLRDLDPPMVDTPAPDGVSTIHFGVRRPFDQIPAILRNMKPAPARPVITQVPDADRVLETVLTAMRSTR